MIERARKVREQWLAVSLETQCGQPKPMLGLPSPPAENDSAESANESSQALSQIPQSSFTISQETEAEREARLDKALRGPLLPDTLREAFRRYKDFDGPDRKMLNIWPVQRSVGAGRFGVRNKKGRLFGGG